jgi:hypothetical protein
LLTAALPPRSTKRGWCDFVAHALLEEIIGVHRVKKSDDPFFDGPLYKLKRGQLARQLCTSPDEISSALSWHEALGTVGCIRRTRIDEDGQPRGKEVYVYPIMAKLQELVEQYQATGRTPEPFTIKRETAKPNPTATLQRAGVTSLKRRLDSTKEGGSPTERNGHSLNCVQTQQKHDDESGGEASAQRREQIVSDDRQRLAAAGVGGEADDDQETQVPDVPSKMPKGGKLIAQASIESARREGRPRSTSSASNNGNAHTSASPTWPVPTPPAALAIETEDEKVAWRKASLFCTMWEQAITRLNWCSVCTTTAGDHKSALKFFLQEPQAGPYFILATAINAWNLSQDPKPKNRGWDTLYHVRSSREIQVFIRSYASGKIQSEIGQHFEINTWADLRLCFTESELIFYRLRAEKVPILALESEDLWENDAYAPDYYRAHRLPLPPEVSEAEKSSSEIKKVNK